MAIKPAPNAAPRVNKSAIEHAPASQAGVVAKMPWSTPRAHPGNVDAANPFTAAAHLRGAQDRE